MEELFPILYTSLLAGEESGTAYSVPYTSRMEKKIPSTLYQLPELPAEGMEKKVLPALYQLPARGEGGIAYSVPASSRVEKKVLPPLLQVPANWKGGGTYTVPATSRWGREFSIFSTRLLSSGGVYSLLFIWLTAGGGREPALYSLPTY